MPQDYEYDVFVSYRREAPVMDWVRNHFHPLLDQWLRNSMPVNHQTRIFIDWDIETGASWPMKLRQALKTSRCLLPVWSPEYFRSEWCLAEWQTMVKREQKVGLGTAQNSGGLIYAVRFFDGEHFPPKAQTTQHKDLSRWNIPDLTFKQHLDYIDLTRQIQGVVTELAKMIQRAPVWQDWPVVLPKSGNKKPRVEMPRLK
ncbi:MAG TPA: toll/interleukin-1 receptor domain-containing protein [Blastocatellia bacterium]|nr:toll/interleukin-1 receptor domain-containing protein [Blastocatellia bacterium]